MAGYGLAHAVSGASSTGWIQAGVAFVGITLAAGGALSLNQWWERKTDALMRRTGGRPLPQKQISPVAALTWSLSLCLGGVLLLAGCVNLQAASLAAATIVLYGLVYTPLKRRTRWATEIGSLSGALPPLLGAAAAGDVAAKPAWVLATVILFWQMPHFFAIGWMYRDDYRTAGFPLLPAIDNKGARTAGWSLAYAVLLAIASLAPWALGWMGTIYGVIAMLGAAAMLHACVRFLVSAGTRDIAGRRLFLTTIVYLPVVMVAMLIDRF